MVVAGRAGADVVPARDEGTGAAVGAVPDAAVVEEDGAEFGGLESPGAGCKYWIVAVGFRGGGADSGGLVTGRLFLSDAPAGWSAAVSAGPADRVAAEESGAAVGGAEGEEAGCTVLAAPDGDAAAAIALA